MNLNFPVRIESDEDIHRYEEQQRGCQKFGCFVVLIAFILAFTVPFIVTFFERLGR